VRISEIIYYAQFGGIRFVLGKGVLLLGWPGLEMIFLFVVGGGVVAVGVAALAANGRGVLAESRRRCGCCCCWRAGGTCGTSRGCSGGCSGVGVVAG